MNPIPINQNQVNQIYCAAGATCNFIMQTDEKTQAGSTLGHIGETISSTFTHLIDKVKDVGTSIIQRPERISYYEEPTLLDAGIFLVKTGVGFLGFSFTGLSAIEVGKSLLNGEYKRALKWTLITAGSGYGSYRLVF